MSSPPLALEEASFWVRGKGKEVQGGIHAVFNFGGVQVLLSAAYRGQAGWEFRGSTVGSVPTGKVAEAFSKAFGVRLPEPLTQTELPLTVVVSSHRTKPVYCQRIQFTLSIGVEAKDLTSNPSGILVSASPSDRWQITEEAPGQYAATPLKPEYRRFADQSVSFHIDNIQVNKVVGSTTLKVQEDTSKDDVDYKLRKNAYKLAKFPYGFYVHNFRPNKPMLENGEEVTLSWSGSDLAVYHLRFDDKEIDVTRTRTWTSNASWRPAYRSWARRLPPIATPWCSWRTPIW